MFLSLVSKTFRHNRHTRFLLQAPSCVVPVHPFSAHAPLLSSELLTHSDARQTMASTEDHSLPFWEHARAGPKVSWAFSFCARTGVLHSIRMPQPGHLRRGHRDRAGDQCPSQADLFLRCVSPSMSVCGGRHPGPHTIHTIPSSHMSHKPQALTGMVPPHPCRDYDPPHRGGAQRPGMGRPKAAWVTTKISTAPFSAAPAMASGTFNPLCKVLCILQSLYLYTIGLLSCVLPGQGYTWHFKLQSQATLLWDTDSLPQAAATHRPV